MKKRLVVYPAIFDDNGNTPGVYSVEFPDVPEALTYGNGMAEALKRAPEALGLSLYEQKKLPTPSDFNQLKRSNPNVTINLITVDLEQIKSQVKIKNTMF